MSYGIGYAGAESDYNDADVVIFGIPYDHTSCFKAGAREAPTAVRRASYNFEEIHFEHGIHQPQLNITVRKVLARLDVTLSVGEHRDLFAVGRDVRKPDIPLVVMCHPRLLRAVGSHAPCLHHPASDRILTSRANISYKALAKTEHW